MQNKPGPGIAPLLTAFLWRWFVATILAWIIAFIIIFVLCVIFAVIYVAATGTTSPDALVEPVVTISNILSIPITLFLVPGLAAAIAFVWFFYSSDFKRLAPPQSGYIPQHVPGGPVPAPSPAAPSDPYSQYSQAYQRWQQEYAAYQQAQNAAANTQPPVTPPPAPEPPAPAPAPATPADPPRDTPQP